MSAPEAKPSEPETLGGESSQALDRPVDEEPQKSPEDPNSSEKAISGDDGGGESKEDGDEDGDEEEEGECGFCLFMKGGGCRESFVSWEKCIEEAEKNKEDIVEKCFEVTGALKKCMDANSDYYEPVLRAEKAAEAEAVKELQKEAAAALAEEYAAAEEPVPAAAQKEV